MDRGRKADRPGQGGSAGGVSMKQKDKIWGNKMLIPLQENDFDQYIDFVYELALDPARSGYPAYFDGVKTKADFIVAARKGFSRPGEEILLYLEDGRVEGWIHYYDWAGDRYLGFRACCIRRNTAKALDELQAYLTARYSDYDLTMGFPAANREAVDWLERSGFSVLDDLNDYHLLFSQYTPEPDDPGVERITEENFEKFQRIYQTMDADMYWNCRRLRENLSEWDIFVAEEDGIAGEITATHEPDGGYEIFSLFCVGGQFHAGLFHRLLKRVLNEGKRTGASHLYFFIGYRDEENRIMPGLGFHLVGHYLSYRKRI